jgi:uncharacterized protein YqgQ
MQRKKLHFPLDLCNAFGYISFINERQTGAALMKNGTRKIFEDLAKDIMEQAENLNALLPQSDNGKASVAEYNATNIQLLVSRVSDAVVDLVKETDDMTGCGNILQAFEYRSNVADELAECFITEMEADAEQLRSYSDPYAEHRLTAHDLGLEAAE